MRYSGSLGIVEEKEDPPGVWEEVVSEVSVIGDLKQRTENIVLGDKILPGVSTTTSIQIHARGVGQRDDSNIRYVTYAGKRWVVTSAVTAYPMLTLFLGEEYHGPLPG